MIRKLVKRVFSFFGYRLTKIGSEPPRNAFTLNRALGRAALRQPMIGTVIDVGASDGRWSKNCMNFYPDSEYLLVEAQEAHKEGLETLGKANPKANYVLAVAGEEDGEVYFDDSQLFGGQASKSKSNPNMKTLHQISLDNEVERRGLKGPYLLKLDTHGFEVPILEGASRILKETELLIIETYNFKLTDSSLRYWEMCTYLDSLGFASIDQADLMLRNKDMSFWQMDTFFIPKGHKAFAYNKYE